MFSRFCVALVMLALVGTFVTAFAGMSSLKIMPGVREAGMGNAGVASAFGPQAIAWNPAASAAVSGFAACVSYAKWFADLHQQSVYLTRDIRLGVFGVGATSFTAGKFEYRTEVPTEDPLGLFVPGEFTLHLNFSRRVSGVVDGGIAARYYYSKVLDQAASGFGFDLGVRAAPWDQLVLGASLVDFGWNLSYYRERFRLPTRARLGVTYRFGLGENLGLNLTGEGVLHVYTRDLNVHSGVELVWREAIALRAGYERLEELGRVGCGLGLRHGLFRLDYSLSALNDNLGAAHRIGLSLSG
ncbi:MAG: PorV/PorQ family protein [candidate division WOR-3 bacterium]